MPNTPNPNIISEEDFFQSLESGEVREVEKPPIEAGAPSAPPSLPSQTIQTLSGSLPASMQFPTDLIKTQMPGIPSSRIWPIAPAGVAGTNSAVTSGTRGISNTANQASKTAASANTTAKSASAAVTVVSSTPVMQVDSGGSVVQAPVGSIGSGGGILTPTLDNLRNGLTRAALAAANVDTGNVTPTHISNQTPGIVVSTVLGTVTSYPAATGWVVIGTVTINLEAGVLSITIDQVLPTYNSGSTQSFEFTQMGFSITSGAGPSTPQASASASGNLTLNSPTTGAGLTLTLYGYGSSIANGGIATGGNGKWSLETVQPFGNGVLT